ncbi:hypothetical protein [Frigoribacterium salinisoli]
MARGRRQGQAQERDVDGTAPVGVVPGQGGGAVASSRRTVALVLGLSLGVPLLVLAVLVVLLVPRPVVTTATGADGQEVELHWAEHPGRAESTVEEVLDGPTLEEGLAEGEAMVAEMQEAVTERTGLTWAAPPAVQDGADVVFPVENGWGGPSLLRAVNLPTPQTTSVPEAWADKQEVIAVLGEVAARHGWSEPVLDEDRWPQPREDRIEALGGATYEEQVLVDGMIEGPAGQWLSFGFTDLSKDDAEGTFAERNAVATEAGWEPSSLTLSYGANGLLPEADRAEFERRAAPFAGHSVPPARLD